MNTRRPLKMTSSIASFVGVAIRARRQRVKRCARSFALAVAIAATVVNACGIGASALFATETRAQTSDAMNQALRKIAQGAPRNKVLHQLQAATLALDSGDIPNATSLFDQALAGISAVYAQTEKAALARSTWYNEGSKDYKGEPYERVMAYYYRGVIDLMAGDLENARASFKTGLMQDAFAEEEQHRADFALMLYLDGWCSLRLGALDLAKESFDEFAKLRPNIPIPTSEHDTLVLIEVGKSPRKLQDGVGGNKLVYRQGKRSNERAVRVEMGDTSLRPYLVESVFWQASTRGGRAIDAIIDGKLSLKSNAESLSTTVADVANNLQPYAPLLNRGGGALAGIAGLAGIGALISSNIGTRADSRYWNNLPDSVHAITLKRPPALSEMRLSFQDEGARTIAELGRQAKLNVDAAGNGLLWSRSRRATDVDVKLGE
jgi:tetratricopeptide (TPR) repeat protein